MLLGLDGVPAATVNRFCASSVQTARMAFHAIKAGEGHAFVSAGVECVSRYRNFGSAGVDRPESHHPAFGDAEQRTAAYARTNEAWHDPRPDGRLPDIYIAMGQTAENVARPAGITRAEQDEFGVRSQNRAEQAIASGFFAAEIAPVTLPDGWWSVPTTAPGRNHAGGGGGAEARCSGPTARSPPATAAR